MLDNKKLILVHGGLTVYRYNFWYKKKCVNVEINKQHIIIVHY